MIPAVPARMLREVFAPPVVVLGMLGVMVVTTSHSAGQAIRLAAVPIVFMVVIPLSFVLLQVRRGRLTDHHISRRDQRRIPLLLAGCGVVVSLLYLVGIHAPRGLIAAVLAGLVGLTVTFAITQVWKISLHVATLAGSVTILVLVFGPPALALVLLVPLIAWSRVSLGDHTPAQVTAGGLVGAATSAAVFLVTR